LGNEVSDRWRVCYTCARQAAGSPFSLNDANHAETPHSARTERHLQLGKSREA
jgi:hypothetical protein